MDTTPDENKKAFAKDIAAAIINLSEVHKIQTIRGTLALVQTFIDRVTLDQDISDEMNAILDAGEHLDPVAIISKRIATA